MELRIKKGESCSEFPRGGMEMAHNDEPHSIRRLRGVGLLSPPASTNRVEAVRTEAAANLAAAKSETSGQFLAFSTCIDNLQKLADESRIDIKTILQRLPERPQYASAPAAPALKNLSPIKRKTSKPQEVWSAQAR